eukprot:g24778.t1
MGEITFYPNEKDEVTLIKNNYAKFMRVGLHYGVDNHEIQHCAKVPSPHLTYRCAIVETVGQDPNARFHDAFTDYVFNDDCSAFTKVGTHFALALGVLPGLGFLACTGDSALVVMMLVTTFFMCIITYSFNTPERYDYIRVSLLPVRVAVSVGIALQSNQLSQYISVLIFSYLSIFVLVIDFILGDLFLLWAYRFQCSYRVLDILPARVFLCAREGAAHLDDVLGHRIGITTEVIGCAWDSRYSLIADLNGLICELRRPRMEELQALVQEKIGLHKSAGMLHWAGPTSSRRTLIGLGANCSVIDHQGLSLLHHSAAWALLQPVAFQLPLSMAWGLGALLRAIADEAIGFMGWVLHQLLLFDTWGDQPLHRALRHRRFSEALAVLRYVELADPVLAQRVVTSANAVTGEQLAHLNADLTLFEDPRRGRRRTLDARSRFGSLFVARLERPMPAAFGGVNTKGLGQAMEELRRLGAQSLSTVTSWGALPWHTVAGLPGSVSSGTLLQLAQLLQVPVETTDTRHRTALHYAAEGGDAVNVHDTYYTYAEALCEDMPEKAYDKAFSRQISEPVTPTASTASVRKPSKRRRAALRARDAQRQMPLQLALAQGHWHIVSIFHAANGYALEAACGFGNVTLVRSMVLEQGYDPHLKDEKNGRSPIFEALEKGQITVAEPLGAVGAVEGPDVCVCGGGSPRLSVGTPPTSLRQNVSLIALDALGVSVLGAAVQAQRWNSVEFLVQRIPVMQRMANDSTALHFAAQGSSQEQLTASSLGRQNMILPQEIIGTLVRSGVLVDAVDYQNRTALFYSHGAEAVEALLAMGASSAHRDRGGRTALHLAAAEGRDAALEALLASRNSQVDGLDAEGRSALHLAVLGGHVGTTRTLLRWCASTLRDQSGQLPNDLAPAGVVRDLLLTGSEEQCQCDCGRFPFNPEWTTETWTNCSTVVRCRSGGSGVALSCERARSVPLTSPGTGQWSEVELYCRTVSGAETDRRSAWALSEKWRSDRGSEFEGLVAARDAGHATFG